MNPSTLQPGHMQVGNPTQSTQLKSLKTGGKKVFSTETMKSPVGMMRILSEDYLTPSVMATASSDEEATASSTSSDEETRSCETGGSHLKSAKGGGAKRQTLGRRDIANKKILSEDYAAAWTRSGSATVATSGTGFASLGPSNADDESDDET